MRLPDSFVVRATTRSGVPLDGVWIAAELTSSLSSPVAFHFLAGPTDPNGSLAITRDFLLADARRAAETGVITAETQPVGAARIELTQMWDDEEDWLPDELAIRIENLVGDLARRDTDELLRKRAVDRTSAKHVRNAIAEYPATFVDPPHVLALLMMAWRHEDGWSVEVPMWSEEEGPSDLVVRLDLDRDERTIVIRDVLVP